MENRRPTLLPTHLIARDFCQQDLLPVFRLAPDLFGEKASGFETAFAAWGKLASQAAFNSTVLELDQPQRQIVGFGLRIFITRACLEAEVANPQPGLVARLAAASGRPGEVILTESQIRQDNTHYGLNAVTAVHFDHKMVPGETYNIAASQLGVRFFELHAGYWFRQILTEATNAKDRAHILETGLFQVVQDFGPGGEDSTGARNSLLTMTREDGLRGMAHAATLIFFRKPSRLGLPEADRQFLRVAAKGLTDEELSQALQVSLSGVKKRWLALFERIGDIDPAFFPQNEPERNSRGRQKRHLVVAYVRMHPEELSPFEAKAPQRSQARFRPTRVRAAHP